MSGTSALTLTLHGHHDLGCLLTPLLTHLLGNREKFQTSESLTNDSFSDLMAEVAGWNMPCDLPRIIICSRHFPPKSEPIIIIHGFFINDLTLQNKIKHNQQQVWSWLDFSGNTPERRSPWTIKTHHHSSVSTWQTTLTAFVEFVDLELVQFAGGEPLAQLST